MDFVVLIGAIWLLGLVALIAYWITVEIFHLKRYSIRALLIVMTIIAVGLGAAVTIIRG